jgi:hypothetical protein
MALKYDESPLNSPLVRDDPNFRKREDTVFKKSSGLSKDYGTPTLVIVKVDGGYDMFESSKGEWSELTSRLVRALRCCKIFY